MFRSALAPAAMVSVLSVATLAPAPMAWADEFVDRANNRYALIRQEHRSDLILFPLIAKMQAPPAVVAGVEKAMMLPHGSSGWSTAEAWAMEPAQRAIIEVMPRVAQNSQMAVGQPYGADAMAVSEQGIALIQDGLYTELGDPPMLAAARFHYLPKLEQVGSLINVEATRLAAEGKVNEAINLLTHWLYFSRQMADRDFFQECRWGLRSMIAALERIRDVAYVDFRSGQSQLTIEHITAALDRLRTADGYLMGDRLTFPQANRDAADQVIARTFIHRGGVNTATFGQTMARLASTKRPLRLFSEAARWDEVGATHANWFDTTEQLGKVYNNWTARWPLDPFDPQHALIPDYDRTSAVRFAVIKTILPDMGVLFNDRQVLRAQLVGTRCALGILAFQYRNGNFPASLTSVRPMFLREIEMDPFNPNRARGAEPLMEFFVPIRDQRFGARETPRPHEINLVLGGNAANFRVNVGQDQFVLYSVGPDGAKDWARNVSGEPAKGMVGDLLLWPPVTSLLRQRLTEQGEFR